MRCAVLRAVVVTAGLFLLPGSASATRYDAIGGSFLHQTNVVTTGLLDEGFATTRGDSLLNFLLTYDVVTNNRHEGTIRVQGTIRNVTDVLSDDMLVPFSRNPVLEDISVRFTQGVHAGLDFYRFRDPTIGFDFTPRGVRLSVAFASVLVESHTGPGHHPAGPLRFGALFGHRNPHPPAEVPEPATMLLLGSGLVGGVIKRRRTTIPV